MLLFTFYKYVYFIDGILPLGVWEEKKTYKSYSSIGYYAFFCLNKFYFMDSHGEENRCLTELPQKNTSL